MPEGKQRWQRPSWMLMMDGKWKEVQPRRQSCRGRVGSACDSGVWPPSLTLGPANHIMVQSFPAS